MSLPSVHRENVVQLAAGCGFSSGESDASVTIVESCVEEAW
jgi:hypothetical protein